MYWIECPRPSTCSESRPLRTSLNELHGSKRTVRWAARPVAGALGAVSCAVSRGIETLRRALALSGQRDPDQEARAFARAGAVGGDRAAELLCGNGAAMQAKAVTMLLG